MPDSSGEISRPLKVLHVDDDPMNLRVVQEILGAFGHQAVMACSGQEALERLAVEDFDIMLLDIHMPGMTGLDVIARLRASQGPSGTSPSSPSPPTSTHAGRPSTWRWGSTTSSPSPSWCRA